MTEPTFNCYKCVGNECNLPQKEMPICNTTINCWKSVARKYKHMYRYYYGCISTMAENENICNNATKKDNTKCCTGDLCNDNNFQVQYDHLGDRTWVYVMDIVLIIVLIICIYFTIYYMRKLTTHNITNLRRRYEPELEMLRRRTTDAPSESREDRNDQATSQV